MVEMVEVGKQAVHEIDLVLSLTSVGISCARLYNFLVRCGSAAYDDTMVQFT